MGKETLPCEDVNDVDLLIVEYDVMFLYIFVGF